jgi:hypothetical protein
MNKDELLDAAQGTADVHNSLVDFTLGQLDAYIEAAQEKGLSWAEPAGGGTP